MIFQCSIFLKIKIHNEQNFKILNKDRTSNSAGQALLELKAKGTISNTDLEVAQIDSVSRSYLDSFITISPSEAVPKIITVIKNIDFKTEWVVLRLSSLYSFHILFFDYSFLLFNLLSLTVFFSSYFLSAHRL